MKIAKLVLGFWFLVCNLEGYTQILFPKLDTITGKKGYVDSMGRIKINYIFEQASAFEQNVALVSQNYEILAIDTTGNRKTCFKEFLENNSKSKLTVIELISHYGVVDSSGMLLTAWFEEIGEFHDSIAKVTVNGKVGYVNNDYNYIIEPIFDTGSEFQEGTATVSVDNKYAFINSKNQLITDFEYDDAFPFSDSLALIKLNDKFGFINFEKKVIIEVKYNEALSFSEDLAAVKIDSLWGYINKKNQVVIPFKYYKANQFKNGIAKVYLNQMTSCDIDKQGNQLDNSEYNLSFEELINEMQKEFDDYRDNKKYEFYNGLALQEKAGKFGYIDVNENIIIPCKYEKASRFSESYAAVCINHKFGFIDKSDNEIIKFQYQDAVSFSESLAKVQLNNKWGFIDKTGITVIPFEYEQAVSFKNGKARVKKNDKWFWIDKTGKCVKDCN